MKSLFGTRSGLALLAVAGVVAALGLSACGGAAPSPEGLAQARQLTAYHVHREDRLRRLEREVRAGKQRAGRAEVRVEVAGSGAAPVSAAPSYQGVPAEVPVTATGACGAGLSVNSHTSCSFAAAVERAYMAEIGSGEGTVEAYSPVTHLSYAMYCSGSPHVCTGGEDAAVYFP